MRMLVTSTPWRRLLAALLLACVVTLAQAQTDAPADNGAPPDRVARLSYIAGDLGFLPAGSQDWASADINRPLTTGDRLSTGDDARAELELGGAALRLDDDTDAGILNLSDNLAQVELTRGTLNLGVRRLEQGQSIEIDTPTLALVVTQPGHFRIDVDSDGHGTRVSVLDGRATVYGQNNASRDVFAGRSYQFNDASLGALMITELQGGDDFDAWCASRDRRYAQSTTRRYVSDEVIGAQDLDQYGDWRDNSQYGAVWYPRQVPVGWAPYRNGHWAFIAPWGWTWVDDSPWGFAPYHYGRWAWIGGAWGWIPGPVALRPVYAPALVAFVGGGRWGVSIGIEPVGWFPLGPGEIYNPWYHCNRAYYQRVNITNIYVHNTSYRTTVINHIDRQYGDYRDGRAPRGIRYANREAPHGFSAMPGRAFADGRRVGHDNPRINPRELAAAPVLAHGVNGALRPAAGGFAPPRHERARPLPVADFRRDVIARTPPPASLPTARAPFVRAAERPSQAAPRPFDNVRVLGNRDTARPYANAPSSTPRQPIPPQADNRLDAGHYLTRPNNPDAHPARSLGPSRNGPLPPPDALPSARYAHPGDARLPNVEPIRPAETLRPYRDQPVPAARPQPERRTDHWSPTPRYQPSPAMPARQEPAPAYQQPRNDTPRETYQPPRETYQAPREPAPMRYQPPREPAPMRYEPPRQAMPMRQEAPHPATPPPREQPRKEHANRDDQRQ